MNNLKDAVGYPYDFAKPEDDPIEAYWTTHGVRHDLKTQVREWVKSGDKDRHIREQVARWRLKHDPWSNGRYAVAALVWGLIIMLVLSVQP